MLVVSHLAKSFGNRPVLRQVDIDVTPGAVVGFLGRNGAGKTTTLRCVAGHLVYDDGTISVDGAELRGASAQVAYLPEVPIVYPHITVWDHLQFVATARGLTGWRRTARDLLERLSFGQYGNYLGKDLSKGTGQKLLVACACLSGACYLLLDEPLVGLDPIAQDELVAIVRDLASDGRGVLFSTHNLDVAARLGQRVVLLRDGVTAVLDTSSLSRETLVAALG